MSSSNSGRDYAGKTVVITGGRGYLASALVDALSGADAQIFVISREELSPEPGTTSLRADIRTLQCWREIVKRADIIFHLAGNTSVYAAAADPVASLDSTVLPLTNLTTAAGEERRSPRVVFASTATVYGLTERLPANEDTPPRPITTYDQHKLLAEQTLALATSRGAVEGISLRLANVYGVSSGASSAADRGIVNRMTKLAMDGTDLRYFGDGNYLRDYVYIDDVVQAFLSAGATQRAVGQSLNVASGTGTTLRDAFGLVVERAAIATGRRVQLLSAPWPAGTDPIEHRNFVADVSRISSLCDWTPAVSFVEGVDRMVSRWRRT